MDDSRRKNTNVASHSLGLIVVDSDDDREAVANLIRKGDYLPRSVVKTFGTYSPNQAKAEFRLAENEEIDETVKDSNKWREIGKAVLDLPPGLPVGFPIHVTFKLDEWGVLSIVGTPRDFGPIQAVIRMNEGMAEEVVQVAFREATTGRQPMAPKQDMQDVSALRIFVSHSHRDAAFCQELVVALRSIGANVWYDEHDMGSGELGPTIERELLERPVFIVILSPDALQSRWVEKETRWAHSLYEDDRTRTILPVVAKNVEKRAIWLFLRDFKRIEAPGGLPYPQIEAIGRVIAAVRAIR